MHLVMTKKGLLVKESNINGMWMHGTEKWNFGTILDIVAGTSDWYNVKYDDEQVLSLNLLLDIEKGDLEFIDTEGFSEFNFFFLFVIILNNYAFTLQVL